MKNTKSAKGICCFAIKSKSIGDNYLSKTYFWVYGNGKIVINQLFLVEKKDEESMLKCNYIKIFEKCGKVLFNRDIGFKFSTFHSAHEYMVTKLAEACKDKIIETTDIQ